MFWMHKCRSFLFRLDKKWNIDENDNLIFEISKWTRFLSVSHLIDFTISEQYSNLTFVINLKFVVLFYDFITEHMRKYIFITLWLLSKSVLMANIRDPDVSGNRKRPRTCSFSKECFSINSMSANSIQ